MPKVLWTCLIDSIATASKAFLCRIMTSFMPVDPFASASSPVLDNWVLTISPQY